MPFGLAPKGCCFFPSGRTLSMETSVQAPTSCSLSDFCWARASPAEKASPEHRSAVVARARVVRRFIGVLRFGCLEGSGRALKTARGRSHCALFERKYGSQKYK